MKRDVAESIPVALLLALSGGFFDAYTFTCRDGVFANAQTGNIVMLGISLAKLNFHAVALYAVPIFAFVFGVLLTERLKRAKNFQRNALFLEIVVLIFVSLIPIQFNQAANALISFVCAIQVDAFRTWHGHNFATTMCTGNLRSATALLEEAAEKRALAPLFRSFGYFLVIAVFIAGAATGFLFTTHFGIKSILAGIFPVLAVLIIVILAKK